MSLRSTISALLLLASFTVLAQENCTVPLPPVLNRVSVKPETGFVDIYWSSSPSQNIAAYIVYTYSEKNSGYMPVDTIWNPAATSYTYATPATREFSIRFVVASYRLPLAPGRPGCPSELSNSLNTILAGSQLDTCKSTITLQWNTYLSFPKKVTGYRILVSENGGPLTGTYTTGSDAVKFDITGFNTNSQYCYAVEAILEDGTASGSNRSCLATRMRRIPEWINTDYITVNNDNNIELSFTVDPASEIQKYTLEKDDGAFTTVATLNGYQQKIVYIDREASASRVNNYHLSAINNCNVVVATSDTSSNIRLVLTTVGDDLMLTWNPFNLSGTTHEYEIFINTGNGFRPEADAGQATEFRIPLKDFIYDLTTGEVCFFVKATPVSNPHGTSGESNSSRACASPGDGITVPNMFTPNNDLRNDRFRPVLAFTPTDYHLVITERQGKVLFESRDILEEWDGSGVEQGVYLWFLRLKTPSGKLIRKTGTITVVK